MQRETCLFPSILSNDMLPRFPVLYVSHIVPDNIELSCDDPARHSLVSELQDCANLLLVKLERTTFYFPVLGDSKAFEMTDVNAFLVPADVMNLRPCWYRSKKGNPRGAMN
jgi:hypothetical protein